MNPLTFSPPPLSRLQKALFLQKKWFAPEFFGLENVDRAKPALYVGNHTLYGTLDGPLMILGLYQHNGVFLRSLGDHIHFQIPLWRNLLWDNGCVAGTPENCQQLMQAKEHILVYPGGGREVMKNDGEQYQLIWKERTGFARMAMQHGYDIVPFAAIGRMMPLIFITMPMIFNRRSVSYYNNRASVISICAAVMPLHPLRQAWAYYLDLKNFTLLLVKELAHKR